MTHAENALPPVLYAAGIGFLIWATPQVIIWGLFILNQQTDIFYLPGLALAFSGGATVIWLASQASPRPWDTALIAAMGAGGLDHCFRSERCAVRFRRHRVGVWRLIDARIRFAGRGPCSGRFGWRLGNCINLAVFALISDNTHNMLIIRYRL